jgi:hypothetical protein
MRTSIILVAVMAAVLGGTLVASAQVSSGSPDAAQQNLAKKTTDKPVQNDQQNATRTVSAGILLIVLPRFVRRRLPRGRLPSPAGNEAEGVYIRSGPHAMR